MLALLLESPWAPKTGQWLGPPQFPRQQDQFVPLLLSISPSHWCNHGHRSQRVARTELVGILHQRGQWPCFGPTDDMSGACEIPSTISELMYCRHCRRLAIHGAPRWQLASKPCLSTSAKRQRETTKATPSIHLHSCSLVLPTRPRNCEFDLDGA